MTERSRFWNSNTVGDSIEAPYDAPSEFAAVFNSVAAAASVPTFASGVFRGELNTLTTTLSGRQLNVNTGRAMVYGSWYENDSLLVLPPIPSGIAGTYTLVARKRWSTQVVRIELLTGAQIRTVGDIWDLPLYSVVNSAADVITLTDLRWYIPYHGNQSGEAGPKHDVSQINDAVSLAGAQILSNKTLSTPTINGGTLSGVTLAGTIPASGASLTSPGLTTPTVTDPVLNGNVSGTGLGTGASQVAVGNHNHDAAYSAFGHNHNSLYSLLTHGHVLSTANESEIPVAVDALGVWKLFFINSSVTPGTVVGAPVFVFAWGSVHLAGTSNTKRARLLLEGVPTVTWIAGSGGQNVNVSGHWIITAPASITVEMRFTSVDSLDCQAVMGNLIVLLYYNKTG